jgi:hypothetical protein
VCTQRQKKKKVFLQTRKKNIKKNYQAAIAQYHESASEGKNIVL